MDTQMSQITRTEMLAQKRARYAGAGKEHKTKIINELVELFGYHRKAAMDEFRADLEKAGIPFLDKRGQRLDYHALRKTFITRLSRNKVHPRLAMELARHSDLKLTMKNYADVGQFPLQEVMDSLPG